jgi:hypothetical protein
MLVGRGVYWSTAGTVAAGAVSRLVLLDASSVSILEIMPCAPGTPPPVGRDATVDCALKHLARERVCLIPVRQFAVPRVDAEAD